MTRLIWDQVEDRRFEAGIDRGVLFPIGRPAEAWNGLTAVNDDTTMESKSYYYEGIKRLERAIPGEYSAKIEAITYPDVLDELSGIISQAPGVRVHDSLPVRFHLSYRTLIGNAAEGIDYGYKIHLIYNVVATPSGVSAKTIGSNAEPTPFSWQLKGMQMAVVNGQPLDHISIDSRHVDPEWLADLEDQLYGTSETDPSIPDPTTLPTS